MGSSGATQRLKYQTGSGRFPAKIAKRIIRSTPVLECDHKMSFAAQTDGRSAYLRLGIVSSKGLFTQFTSSIFARSTQRLSRKESDQQSFFDNEAFSRCRLVGVAGENFHNERRTHHIHPIMQPRLAPRPVPGNFLFLLPITSCPPRLWILR
jgi:hypothetical protein